MILRRDDTFMVVFNLRTPVQGGETIGTGIFVHTNETAIYLVTATHVAKSCNNQSQVVMSDANGSSVSLNLNDFNQNQSWKHHSIADISVLPIQMSPSIKPHLAGRFFPFDHFHVEKTPVSRDFELTSVGFPHGLGASEKFSPLTYRSHASSAYITLLRADTNTPCTFFVLENPSTGGYSGCPVFDLGYYSTGTSVMTKDKTWCHGITHGTTTDETGGKLALITPAYYLADLI